MTYDLCQLLQLYEFGSRCEKEFRFFYFTRKYSTFESLKLTNPKLDKILSLKEFPVKNGASCKGNIRFWTEQIVLPSRVKCDFVYEGFHSQTVFSSDNKTVIKYTCPMYTVFPHDMYTC